LSILAPSSAKEEQLTVSTCIGWAVSFASRNHGSSARITLSLGLARKVGAILKREHFDVIHIHEPLLPMLPLVVLAQSRAATIGTFHAS
jgi:phosphatidylinositol alpha-mannosyltransferase